VQLNINVKFEMRQVRRFGFFPDHLINVSPATRLIGRRLTLTEAQADLSMRRAVVCIKPLRENKPDTL
jgi:hypothetical protein